MDPSEYFLEVDPTSESRIRSVLPGSGQSVSLGNTVVCATSIHALAVLYTRSLSLVHLMKPVLQQHFRSLIPVMMENLKFCPGEQVYWYPGAALLADKYEQHHGDMMKVELDSNLNLRIPGESEVDALLLELAEFLEFDSVVTLRPWRVLQVIRTHTTRISVKDKGQQKFHDIRGNHHSWAPVPAVYCCGEPELFPLACPVDREILIQANSPQEVEQLFKCR